MTKTKDSRRK